MSRRLNFAGLLALLAAHTAAALSAAPQRPAAYAQRHAQVQARAKGKRRVDPRPARPPIVASSTGVAAVVDAAVLDTAPAPAASLALNSVVWSERQSWALEDSVPRYTVDSDGTGPIVLWRRMQVDVPELSDLSVDALRARWVFEHAADAGAVAAASAARPPCLEDWERLPDGSYSGKLTSVAGVQGGLVATVAVDPGHALTSLAEAELWCIRSASGDLFELGAAFN